MKLFNALCLHMGQQYRISVGVDMWCPTAAVRTAKATAILYKHTNLLDIIILLISSNMGCVTKKSEFECNEKYLGYDFNSSLNVCKF